MDLSFIARFIPTSSILTACRYGASAVFVWMAAKGWISNKEVGVLVPLAAALGVGLWGAILSSPLFLKTRTLRLPDVDAIATKDGRVHYDPASPHLTTQK